MDAEKSKRAAEIFQAAVTLEPTELMTFLDVECGDDGTLRREVESLLSHDRDDDSGLDLSLFVGPGKIALYEQESADQPVDRVGVYRLVQEIGRGGMGTVYLGRRTDAELEKEVAVKLLRAAAGSEDRRRRFHQERQILSDMEHPNIARLLDGGTTENGVPYIVMELVDGLPITTYCDRRQCPVRLRLQLFLDVCEAVHYAHRNLVVHRDLKPSNILVTEDGRPKLLDFGIAKVLEAAEGESDWTATETRRFTPTYASPEQVDGERISTASDVYSLGIVLYEMLCGERPFDWTGSSPREVSKQMRTTAPPWPSARVGTARDADPSVAFALAADRQTSPEGLRRTLRGDLDSILAKALRPEPEERYTSIEHMAEDVRRFLDGRPVLARSGNLAYHVGKWMRRHAAAAAVLFLFVGLLTSFAVISRAQQRSTASALEQARIEQTRTEELTEFLVGMFALSDPQSGRGANLTVRETLDIGARRVAIELADQPATQATLRHTLAEVYSGLGLATQARDLAKQALEQRRRLFGERSESVAETLVLLARIRIALFQLKAAELDLQTALDIRRRLFGPDALPLAECHRALAHVYSQLNDGPRAEAATTAALSIPGQSATDRAETLAILAVILDDAGRPQEALARMREGLDLVTGGNEAPDLSIAHTSRLAADFELRFGHFGRSEQYVRDALARFRRLLGPEHPLVAETLCRLARVLIFAGKVEEAEALLPEVEAIRAQLPDYEGSPAAMETAEIRARVHLAGGRYQQAAAAYQTIRAWQIEKLGPDHPSVAGSRVAEGTARFRLDDLDTAEPLIRRGRSVLIDQLGPDHYATHEATVYLGELLTATERLDEAEQLFLDARASLLEHSGEDHLVYGRCLLGLSQVYLTMGRYAEAEDLAGQVHEARRKTHGEHHWRTALAAGRHGRALAGLGRVDEALPLLRQSVQGLRTTGGLAGRYATEMESALEDIETAL